MSCTHEGHTERQDGWLFCKGCGDTAKETSAWAWPSERQRMDAERREVEDAAALRSREG